MIVIEDGGLIFEDSNLGPFSSTPLRGLTTCIGDCGSDIFTSTGLLGISKPFQ